MTARKSPEPPAKIKRLLLDYELKRYRFNNPDNLKILDAVFFTNKQAREYYKWADSWLTPKNAPFDYWDDCKPSDFEIMVQETFAQELRRAVERSKKRVRKYIDQASGRA